MAILFQKQSTLGAVAVFAIFISGLWLNVLWEAVTGVTFGHRGKASKFVTPEDLRVHTFGAIYLTGLWLIVAAFLFWRSRHTSQKRVK